MHVATKETALNLMPKIRYRYTPTYLAKLINGLHVQLRHQLCQLLCDSFSYIQVSYLSIKLISREGEGEGEREKEFCSDVLMENSIINMLVFMHVRYNEQWIHTGLVANYKFMRRTGALTVVILPSHNFLLPAKLI